MYGWNSHKIKFDKYYIYNITKKLWSAQKFHRLKSSNVITTFNIREWVEIVVRKMQHDIVSIYVEVIQCNFYLLLMLLFFRGL